MTAKDLIRKLQTAMKLEGSEILVDGEFGPQTEREAEKFDIVVTVVRKPEAKSKEHGAPWLDEAKKHQGKSENDPQFNKFMSSKWSLVGLNLGTISKNWAAWCGLFVAVSLAGVGYQYQKNGAGARNWDKFGQAIEWKKDGVPRGAIVRINHKADCSSASNNHVTIANGSCTAADILKKGASFNGFGGNQGNTAKVSAFPASHICAVRWPSESEKPGPVEKSVGCSGKTSNESTR